MVKYFETLVSEVFVSMYKSEQQQLSKVYNWLRIVARIAIIIDKVIATHIAI